MNQIQKLHKLQIKHRILKKINRKSSQLSMTTVVPHNQLRSKRHKYKKKQLHHKVLQLFLQPKDQLKVLPTKSLLQLKRLLKKLQRLLKKLQRLVCQNPPVLKMVYLNILDQRDVLLPKQTKITQQYLESFKKQSHSIGLNSLYQKILKDNLDLQKLMQTKIFTKVNGQETRKMVEESKFYPMVQDMTVSGQIMFIKVMVDQ